MIRFAHTKQVYAGTRLRADGGFTCITDGAVLTVQSDKNGLFVPCADGQHYLDGQLDEGNVYVGLSLAEAHKPKRNSAAHVARMGRKAERRQKDRAAVARGERHIALPDAKRRHVQ